MMRILFLSQRVPYPPNRGDKITTWKLVERMKRAHDIRVIAFAHGDDDIAAARELDDKGIPTVAVPYHHRRALLKSLPQLLTGGPLTLGVYGSRRIQREVDQVIDGIDLVYAYSSAMGAFMLRHRGPARVMHMAELDSDKWRQYAEKAGHPKKWIYAREHRTLFEFEKRLAREVDDNVFVTPLEQTIFQELIPGAPSSVLKNGVDLQYYKPSPGTTQPGMMVFTGVMNYFPNVDACVFFAREVLPRVRHIHPEAEFVVVGSQPTADVLALAQLPGVSVTGFVKDTRDYLNRAAVCVAPLRIARGIQNKALEGMAMGLPVVGTTPSTQGIGGIAGEHYIVADGADAQAEAVIRLLDDPERARVIGAAARRFVEDHYDWEVTFAELDRILDRAMAKHRANDRDTAHVEATRRGVLGRLSC